MKALNDMAIPALPQPAGQQEEASADLTGLGGGTLRDRFHTLPSHLRESILAKHRDFNVDHDWWDCVYEEFKDQMDAVGIRVDKMYFSGFWSQGDGACYEGSVGDWTKFLGSLGYTDAVLIDHATRHWSFSSIHSGHYYHEYCTTFALDLPLPDSADHQHFIDNYLTCELGSVKEAVIMSVLNGYDHDSMEEAFTAAFREHMRTLYKLLEADYDHLTSDDAVLEALEANDLLEDTINEAMEEVYA